MSVAALGLVALVALIAGAWDVVAANWRSAPQVSQSSGDAARIEPAAPAARVELAAKARTRPAAPPAIEPVIGEGRRELGDSMYAVRKGPEVTVYFDTELLRTRLDWKFEGIVRATLPMVYGPDVQTALDSIPTGTLARGDILNDLPNRGIDIRLKSATVRVWPVTRPGRDGPLVVAYRAVAAR